MAEPGDNVGKGTKFIKWLLLKLLEFIKWLLWDLSGLRFIWTKIRPSVDPSTSIRPPATFLLWAIGLYVASFGIASQRYENSVDIIENRRNAVLTLIVKDETRKSALRHIPKIQGMKLPWKPHFLDPVITLKSLFSEKSQSHKETIDILKATIEDFRVHLSKADLRDADLRDADLRDANLSEADLRDADLRDADLRDGNLREANLNGAKGLTVEQLSNVRTLYKAKLDPELEEQIRKNYPYLFEKPKILDIFTK